jgi:hypothetical protein
MPSRLFAPVAQALALKLEKTDSTRRVKLNKSD